jgi:beta-galactosidase
MIGEPRHADAPSGAHAGWFEGRDYEYRKVFTPPPGAAAGAAVLELEGVYRDAEVWLDGRRLAERPSGYTGFCVPLTGLLREGARHELRVVARNSAQPSSRWYSGAGLYRSVTLWVGERRHLPLDAVRVTTLGTDPARVRVAVTGTPAGALTVEIFDGDDAVLHTGSTVTTGHAEVEVPLPGARLWGPDHPDLHVCRVTLDSDGQVDTASTTFGIRTLSWGAEGLLINGERTILRGACLHHDNGVLGARAYPDAEERKIRLMRENGYNAVRSAHNPCSTALLDACDRLGVLVLDEYVDHWYVHKTQHDYAEHVEAWWRRDLDELVRKDANHPSVIMYSIGNEVGETAEPRGIALTRAMTEHLHALDPTRPVTCGINLFFNYLSSLGLGVHSDRKAARAARRSGRRKPVGSEYYNRLTGLLGADVMKHGATLRGCDTTTRDAYAALDVAGYNYGIRRYEQDLRRYPDRLVLGTETFCSDADRFREAAERHPRLIGDFVWAGMDYLGEVGIGAWEYRADAPVPVGPGWLTAGSGRVDLTGRPLGEALYTRVALGQAPGPFIAVRPVDHAGERHSPSAWKMTDAIDSWSWDGCEGRRASVEVYARAASVELLINGRGVGRRPVRGCVARFRTRWEPGTVEAVAYDAAGTETGRHALVSAAGPTELRVEPEQPTVAPGRLAFVRLRYTDPAGTGRPQARGDLAVEVSGGTLLGLGSAAPYNPVGYTGTRTGTYRGEALAVVQAGRTGEVEVVVRDGVREGRAVVRVA